MRKLFITAALLMCAATAFAVGTDNCPGADVTLPFCDCGSTVGTVNDHDCGTGHEGLDVVYHLTGLTIGSNYQFIGEASYDADWTIATTCSGTAGQIQCVDRFGTQADPTCSSLTHDSWGYINATWLATQTEVWIWIDAYTADDGGDYCIEVRNLGTPTPFATATATPTPTVTPTPPALGNTCATPFIIDMTGWEAGGGNSFNDPGNTCIYGNDYTEADYGCGFYLTSKEVVYQFTPPETLGLQIDLLGSGYDTKIVITDGCPDSDATCLYNDDYASTYQSGFDCTTFTGGITYYIFIEGFSSGCGEYELNIDECQAATPTPTPLPTGTPEPCPQVTCPSGGVPEGEPPCGDEYVDVYNGGCNSSPYVFQDISCGDVVCGTSGTFLYQSGEYRDTDWYQLVLTESRVVTWAVDTEFDSLLFILDASQGCDAITVLAESSMPCGPNSVTAGLAPGTYWLWIGPSVFTGFPCTQDYVGTVTCEEPPPHDDCSDPEIINLTGWTPGSAQTFSTTGETCSFSNNYNETHYGCGYGLDSPEMVFQFTPPVNLGLQIDLDGSDYDTKLVITDNCPEGDPRCMYNDDYIGGASGFDCSTFLAGVTYYIFVEGYANGCGNFVLNIDECEPPPPTPTPPAEGNDCTEPFIIDMTGWAPGGANTYTDSGDACIYTNDYDETDYGCGSSLISSDVVYQFTPPQDIGLQIDLLNSLYDTYMVITDGCPGAVSTCLYNDDYAGTVQSGFDCMQFEGGTTYYIFVEGYYGNCGDYVLNIDECLPPTPTPIPTPCATISCPPDGSPEGEPDCGPDYVDIYNGGCNSSPYVFQDIECGDVICGTSGYYYVGEDQYRDTDWFRLVLTEQKVVLWNIEAEFDSLLFIMDAGSEDCADYTTLTSTTAYCGQNITGAVLEAGTYWFWVGPDFYSGNLSFDCPSDYVARLSCETLVPYLWCTSGTPYSRTPALAITDAGCPTMNTDTMTLMSTEYVQSVSVRLNITHTYVGDLEVWLEHGGVEVLLIDHRGGSGENFTNTILADNAQIPIGAGAAPFSNGYIPEEALSAFNGLAAGGPWILKVCDWAGSDTGTVDSWDLCVVAGPPPATPTPAPIPATSTAGAMVLLALFTALLSWIAFYRK